MKHVSILILSSLIIFGFLQPGSASTECKVGDLATGKWVPAGLPYPTGNFSCISGNIKHSYWIGHLGGFPSCEERIDIYIPSQFPSGSKSCGVDVNPCGEPLSYFPDGENCCVNTTYYVWEPFDKFCDEKQKANKDPGKPCPVVSVDQK